MGGRPPGERSIDPGELLRSALEKIVFFECRVAQLEAELLAARQVAERARADAATARTAEAGAARELAALREAQAGLSLSELELSERVRLLEAERERLMGGLVERARLGGAAGADGAPGPEEGGADLASFIAELRAEIEALRTWKAAALAGALDLAAPGDAAHLPRPAAVPAGTLDALAGAFRDGGRTGLGRADTAQLKAFLTTRSDQVLWERAMGDLSAAEPADRLRAIAHLEALGARASAPLLATALGSEAHAGVKVALLQALARFEEPFAAALAARELGDARPEVRAAALTALSTLAEGEAQPRLVGALADPSPLVRRRAAVLLNGARGAVVDEALVAALRDPDAGVARAASVALSGRPGELVRRALLRHETNREARAQGRALAQRDELADAPGRTEQGTAAIRTPTATCTSSVMNVAAHPERSVGEADAESRGTPAATAAATYHRAAPIRPPTPYGRTAVAVLEVAPAVAPAAQPAGPAGDEAFEQALLLEVRGALRGRTAGELEVALDAPAAQVAATLAALHARGALTPRGERWWFT